MTLKQLIDHQIYLDKKAAILERRLKAAKAERDAHEFEINARMADEGFEPGDDIKHRGTRWGRQVDYYAKVQEPLEFATWAQANAPHLLLDARPSMTKLNELVQQHLDDGTPLPPGVAKSPKIWVSRRAT